jgi:hypothetical protein
MFRSKRSNPRITARRETSVRFPTVSKARSVIEQLMGDAVTIAVYALQ